MSLDEAESTEVETPVIEDVHMISSSSTERNILQERPLSSSPPQSIAIDENISQAEPQNRDSPPYILEPPTPRPPPRAQGWTSEESEAARRKPPVPEPPGNIDWSDLQEPKSRSERRPNLRPLPRINYRQKRPYKAKLMFLGDRLMSFDQLRFCPFTEKPVVNLRACVAASRRTRHKKYVHHYDQLKSIKVESSVTLYHCFKSCKNVCRAPPTMMLPSNLGIW